MVHINILVILSEDTLFERDKIASASSRESSPQADMRSSLAGKLLIKESAARSIKGSRSTPGNCADDFLQAAVIVATNNR
jgi:hypothetical protein